MVDGKKVRLTGGRVLHDVLISDKYDMLNPEKLTGGRIQKRRHFTTHRITNYKYQKKGKIIKGIYKEGKYVSKMALFQKALREGNMANIVKYGKQMKGKAVPFIKQQLLTKKHPFVALGNQGLKLALSLLKLRKGKI